MSTSRTDVSQARSGRPLRQRGGPRAATFEELFLPLDRQLENVRRWNRERSWGFTELDFLDVELTPTEKDGPLVVDIVCPLLDDAASLGGVQRTFEELWQVTAEQYPSSWWWGDSHPHRKGVRLLDGITHTPGIRRVTVELDAYWNPVISVRPLDVRGPRAANAEVLAASAHFPKWVQAMDGKRFPYVWLSGYQVTHPDYEAWRRLPCLSWNQRHRRINLTDHWADNYEYGWASPLRRASTP